jgi:hypothetical protein
LQYGVLPPHGAQVGPQLDVVSHGAHVPPEQLLPAPQATQLGPQCELVLQVWHTLFSQYFPAPQEPEPVHSTHCPALQTLPVAVQLVQEAPQ